MKLQVLEFVSDKCAPCGGKCCKSYPGTAIPKDFGDSREEVIRKVRKLVVEGDWTLDCWEEDRQAPRTLFVRPATVGAEKYTFDASYGGRCTFLNDEFGCVLARKEMPSQCRSLDPDNGCKGMGKLEAALAWEDYQDFLRNLSRA